jgi:hypothetical protein
LDKTTKRQNEANGKSEAISIEVPAAVVFSRFGRGRAGGLPCRRSGPVSATESRQLAEPSQKTQ